MRYDSLGFPIPPEFERVDDGDGRPSPRHRGDRPTRPGPLKRIVLTLILLGLVGSAVVGPSVLPTVRAIVVQWSLEQAIASEGRGAHDAAVSHLSRAINWIGPDDEALLPKSLLLCQRAMLRIKDQDAAGGLEDATLAASSDPKAMQPQQVRALALLILGDTDASLAAAQVAVTLAGANDPAALNHLAYFRALAGRDLEAALTDVERALAATGPNPEFLDTRGFILHLLGRHHEAIDDLNTAIEAFQDQRRRLLMLGGQGSRDDLAYDLVQIDRVLAVMHHHRGLACRAAGLTGQAEQDFSIAERKGFDPSRGIL